jgi:hypothetical protein
MPLDSDQQRQSFSLAGGRAPLSPHIGTKGRSSFLPDAHRVAGAFHNPVTLSLGVVVCGRSPLPFYSLVASLLL